MIKQFRDHGIGTFWARGSLSALDRACLTSFAREGIEVTLYSYEPIRNFPDGVVAGDASSLLPEAMMDRIRFMGKPDVTHFSDLFRFEMIRQTGQVWVDVDLMQIGDVSLPDYGNLIAREEQGTVNGAILHIANERLLEDVIAMAHSKLDRDLKWGETCVEVLTNATAQMAEAPDIYPPKLFYPIDHDNIWRIFLPSERSYCEDRCAEAATLHLFNNVLRNMGIWKDMAPPEGSYLNAKLAELELLDLFAGTYPEKVMSAMIENWLRRKDGKDLGIRAVVRETFPSIGRTYRHYRK